MGGLFSTLRSALQTIKTFVDDSEPLAKRIARSPGIPQLNTSVPYWTIPLSPIAQHGRDAALPLYADVVIVGSGISGTAIAKALLDYVRDDPDSNLCATPLKVVMLEARDACSGATGRNGGHIVPNVYTEYFELKKKYGATTAQEILRFRLEHIPTIIGVAKDENLLQDSQARLVDDYDAFLHPDMFENAVAELEIFLAEVPKDLAEGFDIIHERGSIDHLQLTKSIHGCILKPGASIHPYRLVTGLLQRLIRYPNFQLFTRTPCINIASNNGTYLVHTPRGDIRTAHVIHATNAWSSHLLPGLRKKIIPTRLHMSTQRPGRGLMPTKTHAASWAGTRGFLFFSGKQDITSGKLQQEFAFDYLTQLLPANSSTITGGLPTAGEFMFGGGAMLGGNAEDMLLANIGVADDSGSDPSIAAYLRAALPKYFAGHWGEDPDAPPPDAEPRVKAEWTGIIAISADMQPWVGRVPASVSGRDEPRVDAVGAGIHKLLAPSGEWICAGYTGEGMVHAWLSGRAVARMVLGVVETDKEKPREEPPLPEPFLITEKRVRAAKLEHIM